MRISDLSAETGVPVATIKYYLREGLLPEGVRSSPTQADYGDLHVRRLRVARALIETGVSVADTRRMLATLDAPPASVYALLGAANSAVMPPADPDIDTSEAAELVQRLGLAPAECDAQVMSAVARALRRLRDADFEVPPDVMIAYLDAARSMARAEIANVPMESAEAAVRYVVLGSVLVEPLILALRRVAEQVATAERFGPAGADPGGT